MKARFLISHFTSGECYECTTRKAVKKLKQIIKKISWVNVAQVVVAFAFIMSPVVIPQAVNAGLVDTFANNCPRDTGVRCADTDIASIFRMIINWALAIAFLLAVIVLIYGGFLYITSAGNAEGAGKGKTAIQNALIGIVIIVLSYVIVQIVYRFVAGSGSGSFGT